MDDNAPADRDTARPYEPPVVVELGAVPEFVLGTAEHDTADMNTARYW